MEILVELIFEIFGEFVLQVLLEFLAEIGFQRFGKHSSKEPLSPWLATIGYAIFGLVAGVISVIILPDFFIPSHVGRILSLVVTPIAAGATMCLIGAWRRKRGDSLIRLDRFGYGFLFALAMALIRFHFGEGH